MRVLNGCLLLLMICGMTSRGLAQDRLESAQSQSLAEIKTQIEELKSEVFAAKARLVQLQNNVLLREPLGASLTLRHKHQMGSGFTLTTLRILLDGHEVFQGADMALEAIAEGRVALAQLSLAPGPHRLLVEAEYRASDISLFRPGQVHMVRSTHSHVFSIELGQSVTLTILSRDRGLVAGDVAHRPAFRVESVIEPLIPEWTAKEVMKQGDRSAPAELQSSATGTAH